MVTETGALVCPVMLRYCTKTVLSPPPLLGGKVEAFVNVEKKTAVKVESSLSRIESAVRQASRRFTDWLPTWVTLFDVPIAGVSSGSETRKFAVLTGPCTDAAMSDARALPHQSPE